MGQATDETWGNVEVGDVAMPKNCEGGLDGKTNRRLWWQSKFQRDCNGREVESRTTGLMVGIKLRKMRNKG